MCVDTMKRASLLIILGLIAVAAILTVLQENQLGIGFINDLLLKREDAVLDKLSTDFRDVVHSKCPNNAVSGCAENLVQSNWGDLSEVHFAIGSNRTHTRLYHTFWSKLATPVSIVLMTTEEQGRTVVSGWRGFIISEGEDADSKLLHGERDDNELSIYQ